MLRTLPARTHARAPRRNHAPQRGASVRPRVSSNALKFQRAHLEGRVVEVVVPPLGALLLPEVLAELHIPRGVLLGGFPAESPGPCAPKPAERAPISACPRRECTLAPPTARMRRVRAHENTWSAVAHLPKPQRRADAVSSGVCAQRLRRGQEPAFEHRAPRIDSRGGTTCGQGRMPPEYGPGDHAIARAGPLFLVSPVAAGTASGAPSGPEIAQSRLTNKYQRI